MDNTFVVSKTKQVYVVTGAPEEVIERAQVAIVTRETWHVMGPLRAHGELSFAPLPAVTCPVVDLSGLPECLDGEINQVIKRHVTGCGVLRVEQFIAELEKLGATVKQK